LSNSSQNSFNFSRLQKVILLFCLVIGNVVFGQTIKVKTIVYNTLVLSNSKMILKNKSLGVKATIKLGDEKGKVIYAETQTLTTDPKGNLTIEIGSGYAVAGKYLDFDFSGGPYTIILDIDPNGGENYSVNITRPFVNQARGVRSTYRFSAGMKEIVRRYIGEFYQGGIIFHLFEDSLGNQHGLIASLYDLTTTAKWGLSGIDFHGFKNATDGKENTKAMMHAGAEPGSAAYLCSKYKYDGYSDWYLPALRELLLLYEVRNIIDDALDNDKNPRTKGLEKKHYWTSTGYSASTSWFFSFYNGGATNYGKNFVFNVRAVRAF
jgi:hypothetical protein